jgi:4-carboxymuconolactone decarboxylase
MLMTDETPRIEPLQPPDAPEIQAALAKWVPPGHEVEPLRLFRTLYVHEGLAGRMFPLGAGILGPTATVPPLLREVAIHRTCALIGSEYEWGVHAAAFGRPLGFSDEQLRSTVDGSWRDSCWDAQQSAVFRLADELHEASAIPDELWHELTRWFDVPQILELVTTAGWYHAIGYVCNAARVQREGWAERFPTATAA